MIAIVLGAMLASAAAQVFAQIPVPPGAENARRAADESQGYPALRFDLQADLPEAPAEKFYQQYFSRMSWTSCGSVAPDREWPSFVDAMKSPPKRVFTRLRAWVHPSGEFVAVLNTSYAVDLDARPPEGARVNQSILVGVISPRPAVEKLLREYHLDCPTGASSMSSQVPPVP